MRWVRCSRSRPCPVCGRTGTYCTVSEDGAVCNCRFESRGGKEKHDASGAPYYVHFMNGDARKPATYVAAPKPQKCIAPPDLLNAVYSAMIAEMPLAASHANNLTSRGLRDLRGYGTLRKEGRSKVAASLASRFGDDVVKVPGVVVKDGDRGRYLTISGRPGLMVPCRDVEGRIVAVKLRADEVEEGDQRYRSLSSTFSGGPGPGAVCHVSRPCGDDRVVRITEGELKADVAALISGIRTLSIPGVSNWRLAVPVVEKLGARTVIVSFDADACTKVEVARNLLDCAAGLTVTGAELVLERWDARHKGVDDALAAGCATELLRGDGAWDALSAIKFSAEYAYKNKRREEDEAN